MERWMKDRATGSVGGRAMSRLFLDQEKKRLQRLKCVKSSVKGKMKVADMRKQQMHKKKAKETRVNDKLDDFQVPKAIIMTATTKTGLRTRITNTDVRSSKLKQSRIKPSKAQMVTNCEQKGSTQILTCDHREHNANVELTDNYTCDGDDHLSYSALDLIMEQESQNTDTDMFPETFDNVCHEEENPSTIPLLNKNQMERDNNGRLPQLNAPKSADIDERDSQLSESISLQCTSAPPKLASISKTEEFKMENNLNKKLLEFPCLQQKDKDEFPNFLRKRPMQRISNENKNTSNQNNNTGFENQKKIKEVNTESSKTKAANRSVPRKSYIQKPTRRLIKTFRKHDELSKLKKEHMEALQIMKEISGNDQYEVTHHSRVMGSDKVANDSSLLDVTNTNPCRDSIPTPDKKHEKDGLEPKVRTESSVINKKKSVSSKDCNIVRVETKVEVMSLCDENIDQNNHFSHPTRVSYNLDSSSDKKIHEENAHKSFEEDYRSDEEGTNVKVELQNLQEQKSCLHSKPEDEVNVTDSKVMEKQEKELSRIHLPENEFFNPEKWSEKSTEESHNKQNIKDVCDGKSNSVESKENGSENSPILAKIKDLQIDITKERPNMLNVSKESPDESALNYDNSNDENYSTDDDFCSSFSG